MTRKICKHGHEGAPRNKAGACSVCVKKYQKEYRKTYASRKNLQCREKHRKRRLESIAYLGGKCLDCGTSDERVLVFDHVSDKSTNVARLLTRSWEKLKAELMKCELVCANCHLIRTNVRIESPGDSFIGRRQPGTHCKHGHLYVAYVDNRGMRSCLECRRAQGRKYARQRSERRKLSNEDSSGKSL